MNKYIGIGNLTQDPECKDVGETKVCNFGIAVNEYYYTNGEKKQNTLFLDVETWSKQAENCTKFLSKGKKVAIEGKLKTNSWEKNGKKYTKIYCLAEKVHFLASEESPQSRGSEKPSMKEVKNIEEKIENTEVDIDDIDDIPFDMENIIYKGAINALSFGNVSYNILREFYRKNITVAFFPYGENLNFQAFDKIDADLQQWIVSSSQNRFHLIDKDYPTLSQWHINGSETRISRRQFLYTAHETDSVTNIEKSIALMQDKCIFNSNHSVQNFKDAGCNNIDFVPLGFDEDFKKEDSVGFTDKIHFGLMGKFEKRKNTAQILKNWVAQYGNNYDYQLSCCINNDFLKPGQLNQLIGQALDGKQYGNVNFLPHLNTNSEVNTFLNSIDIDLSGLSGAEGWNLPAFNATALGKWSIVINCTAHKDWANKSNSILIEPDSQSEIYDQMFFIKGQAFNQGNMNIITDETMIKAFKSAEKKFKKENKEGLKLQNKFTYEKTVNQLLKIIQNEK